MALRSCKLFDTPALALDHGHLQELNFAHTGTIARGRGKRGASTNRGGSTAGKKRKASTPLEEQPNMNNRQPISIEHGWAEMEVGPIFGQANMARHARAG